MLKFGELELTSLSDGTFRLDGGAMFGVVPKPLWEKRAPPDERNRIGLALRPLLVRGEKTLLIDAGCEYDYYASDVTRTLPVGGRYSRRQRAVYEVVLEAQRAAIDKVRAGAHWNAPHEAAVRVITRGLVRLGLLKGRVPALIRQGAYRPFYMHRVGHWLGMDVHDVGEYKVGNQWRLLEPGMVTTIEPGIYIPPGSKAARREWWGIGVRIEDDVAVTAGKPDVLTAAMPTDPKKTK